MKIFFHWLALVTLIFGVIFSCLSTGKAEAYTFITYLKNETFEDASHWFDGWTLYSTASGITRDTAIKHSGAASMKIVDDNATAGEGAQMAFTGMTQYRLSGWYYPAQTDQPTLIYTQANSAHIQAYVLFQNDGNIDYFDGSYHVLQAYSATTWYQIEIRANVATESYDIFINNILIKRGAAFYQTGGGSSNLFVLRGWHEKEN